MTTFYHFSPAELSPGTVLHKRTPLVPIYIRDTIDPDVPLTWLGASPDHAQAWGSTLGKGAGRVYEVEVPDDAPCFHVQGCIMDLDPSLMIMPLRADEAVWWHEAGLWRDAWRAPHDPATAWDPHYAEIVTTSDAIVRRVVLA